MDQLLDLLGGLPRVALSPSHLLNGEVTTPYGQDPSPEAVEAAWRDLSGDRILPPWILLGRRDTPNGTVWRLSWCPPRGPLPASVEVALPEGLWALELLTGESGPEGWHLRILASPLGTWVGLWEGARCERLHGPHPSESGGVDRVRAIAARTGVVPTAEIRGVWSVPSGQDLRALAGSHPESDLLPTTESVRRGGIRADHAAFARILAILAAFATVTVGLGLVQAAAWSLRRSQDIRLESVQPLLDRVASLRKSRAVLRDSIWMRKDALAPNAAVDRILAGIARKIPDGASLQALALERSDSGWRVRTEASLSDWNQVQPFAQSLRAVPGVAKVVIASQARSGSGISAVLELEGTWP
ncbi:MAG TPA: hypothetical protein VN931_07595 [Fibrobacteria bacterium]|nr:hypothetical protein [Fibrobacteria bacterium]